MTHPSRDADASRRRIAVISLTSIATGAVLMLATRADPPTQSPAPRPAGATPTALTVAVDPPPTETRIPRRVTGDDVQRAKRTARRFLAGYLAYTYGRRHARSIPATTRALRRQLTEQPPRVPRRDRRRRAQVEMLQNEAIAAGRISLIALVNDRARRYSVHLTLEPRDHGWLVTDVGA